VGRDHRTEKSILPSCGEGVMKCPIISSIGNETNIDRIGINSRFSLLHVRLRHIDQEAGIAIALESTSVGYCPTGLEEVIIEVRPSVSNGELLVLPCSNGLLKIGPDCFIIKKTATVHVAARLYRDRPVLKWLVSGKPSGRTYIWEFVIMRGSPEEATALANTLNAAVLPKGWLGVLGFGEGWFS
jgi:hypothetical protein